MLVPLIASGELVGMLSLGQRLSDRGYSADDRVGDPALPLYDIDRIVSRTVTYAVTTTMLAGVYVGGVALLTNALPFSEFGTAASVLVAVALFAPLRRRVQRLVVPRLETPESSRPG